MYKSYHTVYKSNTILHNLPNNIGYTQVIFFYKKKSPKKCYTNKNNKFNSIENELYHNINKFQNKLKGYIIHYKKNNQQLELNDEIFYNIQNNLAI